MATHRDKDGDEMKEKKMVRKGKKKCKKKMAKRRK